MKMSPFNPFIPRYGMSHYRKIGHSNLWPGSRELKWPGVPSSGHCMYVLYTVLCHGSRPLKNHAIVKKINSNYSLKG